MGKQVDNTFTWVIKNVSTMQAHKSSCYKELVVGGCNWRLIAYPEVNDFEDYLSVSLDVPDCESLPSGWRRIAKITLTLVNQLSQEFSQQRETQCWFDQYNSRSSFLLYLNISAKYGGFLVNDAIMIVVAVDVLEVNGSLDAPEKSQSMDVKGFQVLPSQVKSVNCLFERHPDIASKLSIKNQSLKTAYMNVLLSLTETLHQSPKEISKDDLSDAKTTLAYLKSVGFKLDWLENKLDELFKKEKEAGKIRVQKIEEEFKDMKKKCSSLEALLKKEKADVLGARGPFSLFDKDDDLKWVPLVLMLIMIIAFI